MGRPGGLAVLKVLFRALLRLRGGLECSATPWESGGSTELHLSDVNDHMLGSVPLVLVVAGMRWKVAARYYSARSW